MREVTSVVELESMSIMATSRPWLMPHGARSRKCALLYIATHSHGSRGTDMSLIRWVRGLLTHRGKALSRYRAGMAKAKKGDYNGAIADYSAAIGAPDIPTDVRAMVTYNRALAYSAIQEHAKAADDLAAMLKMPGLSEEIKTAAHQRRERIRKRNERDKKPDGL